MAVHKISGESGQTAIAPEPTRYARIRRIIIGDPSLYVELVLPQSAFEFFCQDNNVQMMTEEQAAAVDADMEKWRYGEAT